MAPDLSVYLDELRQEGELDSAGTFSLDHERALERLRSYQLPNSDLYVIPLVASAVAGGASQVVVTCGRGRCLLESDGHCFGFEELAGIFSSLLIGQSDPARIPLRELAVGLNAIISLGSDHCVLESWDGERGGRLELLDSQVSIRRLAEPPDVWSVPLTVRIQVTRRPASLAKQAQFQLRAEGPEVKLLQEHCALAPIPIVVNGVAINAPLVPRSLCRIPLPGWADRPQEPLPLLLRVPCEHPRGPVGGPWGGPPAGATRMGNHWCNRSTCRSRPGC